jgi:hypothetical protein
MISIKELENLPEEIYIERRKYCSIEYLAEKRWIVRRKGTAKKWTDVRSRGSTMGKSATDTVIRLRFGGEPGSNRYPRQEVA